MRPEPGQVLHFSEDPGTRRFVPHVAATSTEPDSYVWAVDAARSPDWPHAHVAVEPVEPLGPAEPMGDLLQLHAEAGIQLRLLDNLSPFWDEVITSTVGLSGIRLRNARPHP